MDIFRIFHLQCARRLSALPESHPCSRLHGHSFRIEIHVEGPIDPTQYEGAYGCAVPNHHVPRMRDCRFHAAYPLAQVELADRDVPLRVRLEAFNPLIPGEVDDSGAPIAVLRRPRFSTNTPRSTSP